MKATGLTYPATRPALGRLAHIRAVLAVRLWLQASAVYTGGRAWWRSERRIRAALGGRLGAAHLPDAEAHWPSLNSSPCAGQVWAIEAELTPKPLARTVTIMRGWPPARLWRAAAWSLPMTAVYATGQAIRLRAWPAVALAPLDDWGRAWRLLASGSMLRAGLLVAPVAVPAGLAIAGALWAWRIYAITTGLAGLTASAPITFDTRQWRRQARTARGRAAAPGTVPLLGRGGKVVIGPVIRAIRHPWRPILAVPYRSFARHAVIIGSSGSGKTSLMMRLWAGWYAAASAAHQRQDGDRPLLVVLDCKGGPDARVKAERTRRCCTASAPAGSRSGPTRPGSVSGTCRPATSACCCCR